MYVPEAFREWGETLYEWNTYCVTRAIESGSGGLEHTTMRQVPLTACESVQAQHELESKVSSENACLALGESGCAAMAAAAFTREGRTRDASVSASFSVVCSSSITCNSSSRLRASQPYEPTRLTR